MLDKDFFYKKAQIFLENLNENLTAAPVIFPRHWHIDHICYRSNSIENYTALKKAFETFAALTNETLVNGRPIATYELQEPLIHNEHIITWVELPAPKATANYNEGFEHIEMVCDVPLEELPSKFPHLHWQRHLQTKYYNEEMKLTLPSGAIKFHHQSLASVVALEKQTEIFNALTDSKILEELRRFHPLVVGTFPLGLATKTSDIDIVLSHSNLQEVSETILKYYSHLPEFRCHFSCVLNRDRFVAHFLWNGIPIELFAQTTPSFEQNGYRHFVIEERLLKVGGPRFRSKLVALRAQGLKTEPAFAKALKLSGSDPFEALLKLHSYSDRMLLELVKNAT